MHKNMERIFKYIIPVVLAALLSGLCLTSCESDDGLSADPVIHYIRVTDPAKADSLLVKANMGNLIAIIGENLGNVVEVWFNDLEATLVSTYITNRSIIVNVPNLPPQEINNKITLVTKDGRSFQFDFTVTVPPPVLRSILCEYVPDGGIVVLKGDFFFEPEVFFTDNLKAEVVSNTQTEIRVKVPAGSASGPITVKTLFGSVKSSFHFRDTRGIFWNFDNLPGGGWRPGNLQNTNPDGVSGNYALLTGKLNSSWDWVDSHLEIDLWGQSGGRPQGPLWQGGTAGKALRFEAYVINDWSGGYMQLIFSPWSNSGNSVNTDNTIAKGHWKPWQDTQSGSYKTDGWITVTVPLSEFIYNHSREINNLTLKYPENCGSLTVFVWGPITAPCDVKIAVDNFRVVDL